MESLVWFDAIKFGCNLTHISLASFLLDSAKPDQTPPVLDLGFISIASLGPRASTKVESHVNFTESQKVSQPNFFFAILNTEKLAETIN